MLELSIGGEELFDESKQEFINIPGTTLKLEHSLLSISKWESKWKKSFLDTKPLSPAEFIDYVRCMTIGKMPDADIYEKLDARSIKTIDNYINDLMTATTFSKHDNKPPSREIITSELVYYWMIEYGIPFECEKWHFNRLMTLIRVCGIKGSSGKKMSQRDILKQNAALNAARRKKSGSKG